VTALLVPLLLKVLLTAAIVVAASVVVERSGPFIGSLIASLPTAGGAALIILALEHPPSFVAQSMIGSVVANAVCAVFALVYAALAQRNSLAVSLGSAYGVWFLAVYAARFVDWTMARAVLLSAIVFPLTIIAGRHFRVVGTAKRISLTAKDLAGRAIVVTVCVITVTAAAASIGSFVSGIFVFFPVAMGSFFIILHTRVGGPIAASVAAHVQVPLIGLGLGLLTVYLLAEPAGVWWAYGLGLCVGLGWNVMLWLVRQRRR